MRKGTTPTHIFELPFDSSDVSKIKITYQQNNSTILTKRDGDLKLEGNTVSTTLTQEETFLFDHTRTVYIQVRVLNKDGIALTSEIMAVGVDKCLDDEVLQ